MNPSLSLEFDSESLEEELAIDQSCAHIPDDEIGSLLQALMSFDTYFRILEEKGFNSHELSDQRQLHEDISSLYKSKYKVQEIPSCMGISLRALLVLKNKLKEVPGYLELTTNEVFENVVRPLSLLGSRSIAALLAFNDSETSNFLGASTNDAGKANIFVSHAWRSNFDEMVMALQRVESSERYKNVENKFYWIDVFSNNQHRRMRFPSNLSDVIGRVKRTVCILYPWSQPIILTRCWCLWEIFCSIRGKATIEFVLSKREESALRSELRSELLKEDNLENFSFGKDTKWYPKLDLENAEARDESDKNYIQSKIALLTGGYDRIEKMVISVLKDLYAREIVSTAYGNLSKRSAAINAKIFLRNLNRLDEDDNLTQEVRITSKRLAEECRRVIEVLHRKFSSNVKIRNRARNRDSNHLDI